MFRCAFAFMFCLSAAAFPLAVTGGESQNRIVNVEVLVVEVSGEIALPDDGNEVDLEQIQTLIQHARENDSLQQLTRVKLTTVDTHEAMIQLGDVKSVPKGRMVTPNRGSGPQQVATTYQQIDTGSIIQVLPTLDDAGNILMNLDINQSRLGPAQATADELLTPQGVSQLTIKTTVKLRSGQAMLLAGAQQQDEAPDQRRTLVVVRAQVED